MHVLLKNDVCLLKSLTFNYVGRNMIFLNREKWVGSSLALIGWSDINCKKKAVLVQINDYKRQTSVFGIVCTEKSRKEKDKELKNIIIYSNPFLIHPVANSLWCLIAIETNPLHNIHIHAFGRRFYTKLNQPTHYLFKCMNLWVGIFLINKVVVVVRC